MNEGTDLFNSNTGSPETDDLQQFLERWLTQASPSLVEAARYAALPHSFDVTLLRVLWGTNKNTAYLIECLERAGFITAEDPNRYEFQPLLRSFLLRRWQIDDPEAYRLANDRAAEFYRSRLPNGEADQIEYVYHQLGANDARGINVLSDVFERAWMVRSLGLVERLLTYAEEQAPVLGPSTQTWLHYFQIRLDIARYRYAESEEALRPLVAEGVEPRLRAQALMSLANVLVETQRWNQALDRYTQALDLFMELDDKLSTARVFAARGMAYVQLAVSLGGLPQQSSFFESRYQDWWRRILHAPFLFYRWFSRRLAFLPNLYFGTNYQDWFIIRLMYVAISQFRQAAQQLAKLPLDADPPSANLATDIQIRLADLYHQVGRWTLAERQLEGLEHAAAVRASDYYWATLRMVQGRVTLARLHLDEARTYLQEARLVFIRYGDPRTLSAVDRLLGDTEIAAGNPEAAILFYTEGIKAGLTTNDLLSATDIWFTLMAVRERFNLSHASQSQIDSLEHTMGRRAYIARFPGALLKHFRKLAMYVVAPVTYVVGGVVGIQTILVVSLAEIQFSYLVNPAYAESLTDLAIASCLLLAILFLTLWMYEFLYIFAGWLFMRGLRLGYLAQHQPRYVVTFGEGIAARYEHGLLHELPWNSLEGYITIDRSLWRGSIPLVSRVVLLSGTTALVLDGIFSHYSGLQRDIASRLEQMGKPAARQVLDFSFLGSRWMLIALLLTILATVLDLTGLIEPQSEPAIIVVKFGDHSEYNLYIASVWLAFSKWALNVFPLLGLARLLHNRAVVRRRLGTQLPLGPEWPLWLSFVLVLLLNLFWIWGLIA